VIRGGGLCVTATDLPVEVNADYLGSGSSVSDDFERDAIRTVARTEALSLDPVYTSHVLDGLIDLIHREKTVPPVAQLTGRAKTLFAAA
jgi:1-aminocyclopropane-1-carboxylate deaminase/D-cysteine desulfhydrase-like pyridoxal-dependent ACC family enzyme